MNRRCIARKVSLAAVIAVAVTGFSPAAFAHVGDHSHLGLVAGLAHPFSGLDHMLAMVAVGLWASQLGRPAMWLMPLTFPAVMAIGAALGSAAWRCRGSKPASPARCWCWASWWRWRCGRRLLPAFH